MRGIVTEMVMGLNLSAFLALFTAGRADKPAAHDSAVNRLPRREADSSLGLSKSSRSTT